MLIRAVGGRLRVLPRSRQVWFVIPFLILASWAVRSVVDNGIRAVVEVGPDGTYNDIPPAMATSDRWLAWFTSVALTVVVEELLYRAAVPTILGLTRLRWAGAVIVSSVAWGLHHGGMAGGYNVAESLGIAASGLVTGYAVVRFQCLAPGLIAHTVSNLISGHDTAGAPTEAIAVTVTLTAAVTGWASGMWLLRRFVHEYRDRSRHGHQTGR